MSRKGSSTAVRSPATKPGTPTSSSTCASSRPTTCGWMGPTCRPRWHRSSSSPSTTARGSRMSSTACSSTNSGRTARPGSREPRACSRLWAGTWAECWGRSPTAVLLRPHTSDPHSVSIGIGCPPRRSEEHEMPEGSPVLQLLDQVSLPFDLGRPDVMSVTIELEPGSAGSPPHRHSGPVFAYLIEGELIFELEGEPQRVIKAGEAFWEPGGDLVHWQAANNLSDGFTKFL